MRGRTAKVAVHFPQEPELVQLVGTAFPDLHVVALDDHDALQQHPDVEVYLTNGVGLRAEHLAVLPRLRWIQCVLSGTDQFIGELQERPEVIVTSARGIHGAQMAEMALLHMLALARRVGILQRQQTAHVWRDVKQENLEGKTVGIVGLGASGRRLAVLCKALGMTVHAVSRGTEAPPGVDLMFPRNELAAMATDADFLVVLVPYDSTTSGLINAAILKVMKRTAFVINLARGGVLVEEDLVAALEDGGIAGAGLDVADPEPLDGGSLLWDLESVFITPHLAGRSDRYAQKLLTLVVEPNLRAFLDERPDDLINVERPGRTGALSHG